MSRISVRRDAIRPGRGPARDPAQAGQRRRDQLPQRLRDPIVLR